MFMFGLIGGAALKAMFMALLGIVFIGLIILICVTKGLAGMFNANKVTRVIGSSIIGIFIIIVGFSVIPFGTDAASVVDGYNNTRSYAKDAKTLAVSVDNFKNEVEQAHDDQNKRDNNTATSREVLGKYGELLDNSVYITYTQNIIIPKSFDNAYASDAIGYSKTSTVDISGEAVFDTSGEAKNYLTVDGTGPCDNHGDKVEKWRVGGVSERGMFGALQCAAFANFYINEVEYKDAELGSTVWKPINQSDKITSIAGLANYGSNTANDDSVAWVSYGKPFVPHSGKDLSEFFTNVTPGTFVRNKVDVHSYIILGANETEVVIYDCNSDIKCGIKLHRWTWDEMYKNHLTYRSNIICVIAPPGTNLPNGCLGSDNEDCLTSAAKVQMGVTT